jgi:hypothetical protein
MQGDYGHRHPTRLVILLVKKRKKGWPVRTSPNRFKSHRGEDAEELANGARRLTRPAPMAV